MGFTGQLRLAEKHLAAKDKRMAGLILSYGPCRLKPHQDYYSELVSSIVGQQLSAKAGDTIWRRVLDIFGNQPPTPQQLLEVNTQTLRDCGVSYAKVAYMKDLAQHIIDGRLDMAHIAGLPNNDLIDQLTAVKGIGRWSAHMFMIFSLGRLDILPVGDLGIKKAVMKNYGFKRLPNPEELAHLAKKNGWEPYQSVASWYLWRSLENT